MNTDETGSAADAVAKLAATKAEHRQILGVIATDAGMSPATRKTLVEHLMAEEDEQVRRIAQLSGGGGAVSARGGSVSSVLATPAASAGASPFQRDLTVGSLRPEPPVPDPQRLGSLRGR